VVVLGEEGTTEIANIGIDGGMVRTQREEGCFWIVTGIPNTGVEYNWADGILYVAEDVPFHGNEVVFDCTLQRYLDVVLCSMDIHAHSIGYRCGMGEHMWQ
jgi:hypothetical protein